MDDKYLFLFLLLSLFSNFLCWWSIIYDNQKHGKRL